VVREVYLNGNESLRVELLNFMLAIEHVVEILNYLSAYGGSSCDAFRAAINGVGSGDQTCLVLQKCGALVKKVKEIVDLLIKEEVYKPQVKFQEKLG